MIKKDIIKAIVFLAILFILIQSINMYYYKNHLYYSQLEEIDRQFYENKDADILNFGASHSRYSLNPEIINNSFNYGSDGEDYIYTYHKLKSVIEDKRIRPDIVTLQIDLGSFSFRSMKSFDYSWYWTRHVDFLDLAYESKDYLFVQNEIRSRIYFIGEGEELFKPINKKALTKIAKGQPIETRVKRDNEAKIVKNRAKKYFMTKEGELRLYDETLIRYYEKILKLTHENNITLILINFPVSEEYYNASMKIIKDKESYYNKIYNITDKYDNAIILDYQDYFFKNKTMFFNTDHLNYYGSIELSKAINEDIKKVREERQ